MEAFAPTALTAVLNWCFSHAIRTKRCLLLVTIRCPTKSSSSLATTLRCGFCANSAITFAATRLQNTNKSIYIVILSMGFSASLSRKKNN